MFQYKIVSIIMEKMNDNHVIDKVFKNYEEKLYYVASRMPDVFSEGTKFEKPHLKVIK